MKGTLEDYVGESVKKGWVSMWWAYRGAHEANLEKVLKALKDQSIPELQE